MTGWRKKQVFQKINTYEARELGVHTGKIDQRFKPAWMCVVCKKIFFNKEDTELHNHNEKREEK
jgi:hypothetical protein